jgi:hypothetical protein
MTIRLCFRAALVGLFWVWGGLGLIGNLLSLNSEIGIAGLSSQLLWIGGMLLFGLGVLLVRPDAPQVSLLASSSRATRISPSCRAIALKSPFDSSI